MQIIKDLIPFQQETIGSNRLRKLLSLALIVGLLQTFSWTYQVIEAPVAEAASTYAPANAGESLTILSGIETLTITLIGGGAGTGATDGAGNTLRLPGARGKSVLVIKKPAAGGKFTFYPGNKGSNGATGTGTAGGAGGTDTDPTWDFYGGNGGAAGINGSSGSGGGGGAATSLYYQAPASGTSSLTAVAGGAGGGGGSANVSGSGTDGYSTNASTNGSLRYGANGTSMNSSCNSSNDGGGGGGGGGGLYAGAGGTLITHTSECSGNGGYRGANWYDVLNSMYFSASDTTDTSDNSANGSVSVIANLSTPSSISASATANTPRSISVSWATAAAARSFNVKLYASDGTTLLTTKSVASGNYSTTLTTSDYASLANFTIYYVSVTAIGNSEAPYVDSLESSRYAVRTNAATGATSDTDTAISLSGSSGNHLYALDNSGVTLPDTFTVEAWIYPTGFACKGANASPWSSSDGYCHIVSKGALFSLLTASTTNITDAGVTAGQLGFNWNGVKFSKYVLNLNEWHHVSFSREGATSGLAKLYVDGNLIYTDTATANSANTTRDFTIGASRSDCASTSCIYGTFNGQIDEVKLSSRFRTQSEIQSDLKTHNPEDSVFKLYYDFNENSGTTVFNRAIGATSATDLIVTGGSAYDSQKIYQIDTTTSSAYTIVKFYRSYLVNANGWTSPANVNSMRYLVLGGGGGGGGGYNGGGGGAGGYRETNTSIIPSTVYSIEVGVGGTGAQGKFANTSGTKSAITRYSVSTDSITASGGGKGATEQQASGGPNAQTTPDGSAESGGSGGGGVHGANNSGVSGSSGNSGGFNPVEGYTGGNGASGIGYYVGGGGGGASSVGGNATASTAGLPGNGGTGVTTNITGSAINLAGGGAGAGRFVPSATVVKHGTATHGGGSGACAAVPCSTNTDTGTAGTANTGGGGGAGASDIGIALGGSGGSGFVVIRYITSKPTVFTQPTDDTSTVGAVDTFTISTSVAPAPLTKSVQWQFTADTTTAVIANITGWTNVSTGTGFTTDTFTTAALTKSMNKYRYRAIVTFSDTATISSIETSSVVTLVVNDSITITSDTSTITRKYGDTQTVRSIAYSGGTTSTGAVGTSTSHTVNTPFGALANGKIYVDTLTSTAKFKVDTGTVVGTYYETVTVTDFKGAVSSYTQMVLINPADTLTVQADTLTAITYNPSGMTINPTATLTGLVNSDTYTSITYSYSASGSNCANGGACSLGNTGPGGGIVFYISGNTYYEAAPKTWYTAVTYNGGSYSNTNTVYCANASNVKIDPYNPPANTSSTGWGGGKINTDAFRSYCAKGAVGLVGTYTGGGKSDWYIPNLTEMNGLQSYWSGLSQLSTQFTSTTSGSYWTSDATYNATWGWALTQPYFNSNGTWSGAGTAYNHQGGLIIPIRTFSTDGSAQPALAATTNAPTNAGTYTITPSALVLANNVDTSNYVTILYRSSTFIINKATQESLTLTSKLGSYNGGTSSMLLTTKGGTDTGTVTYSIVSGGTASGCSVTSNVLSFTSAGTCKVIATKAATINYLITYSDTVTITLSAFVSHQPIQTQQYPNQIPLNGKNALDTTTATIPNITSITNSGGGAYIITGTGFTGVTRVVIGGTDVSITGSTATTINISGAGASFGPLFIECSDGRVGPVPFYIFTP